MYEVEGVLFIKTEKEHVISAESSSQILDEAVGERSIFRMVAIEQWVWGWRGNGQKDDGGDLFLCG